MRSHAFEGLLKAKHSNIITRAFGGWESNWIHWASFLIGFNRSQLISIVTKALIAHFFQSSSSTSISTSFGNRKNMYFCSPRAASKQTQLLPIVLRLSNYKYRKNLKLLIENHWRGCREFDFPSSDFSGKSSSSFRYTCDLQIYFNTYFPFHPHYQFNFSVNLYMFS